MYAATLSLEDLCLLTDFPAAISISEEHTEGLEWTFGSELGINAGQLSLGGSWSVAESVSDSFGEGAAPDCPPGKWRCSIVVTPSVVHVKGHLKRNAHDLRCKVPTVSSWDGGRENDKFEYKIPIKDKAGNAQVSIDLCTCKNRKNWADPGHPGILCPKNCGSS